MLVKHTNDSVGKRADIADFSKVGGGIVGEAFDLVASFTNASGYSFEKNPDYALVNSNTTQNANTPHRGDNETNFSLAKSLTMKGSHTLMMGFVENNAPEAYETMPSMALAVGDEESRDLRERFRTISPYYPGLELLDRKGIERVQEILVRGRAKGLDMAAQYRTDGAAVDYHLATKAMTRVSRHQSLSIEYYLNTKVEEVVRGKDFFEIHTDTGQSFKSRFLNISAGPYSLLFAKAFGCYKEAMVGHTAYTANDYGIIPMAGNFYEADCLINGKVYTMNPPKFPFASIHVDKSIHRPWFMRFGPTTNFVPFMERRHRETFGDFRHSGLLTPRGLRKGVEFLFNDLEMVGYLYRNFVYQMPIIGKRSFLKNAVQKIIPTMRLDDLRFLDDDGGLRPQLFNILTGELEMGTGKFLGPNVVCNVTPSPGASDSIRCALIDLLDHMIQVLPWVRFDEETFKKCLGLKVPVRSLMYPSLIN